MWWLGNTDVSTSSTIRLKYWRLKFCVLVECLLPVFATLSVTLGMYWTKTRVLCSSLAVWFSFWRSEFHLSFWLGFFLQVSNQHSPSQFGVSVRSSFFCLLNNIGDFVWSFMVILNFYTVSENGKSPFVNWPTLRLRWCNFCMMFPERRSSLT